MGKIRISPIKKGARQLLMGDSKNEFGLNFDENKIILKTKIENSEKSFINKLAGYITRLKASKKKD